jgi:predicted metal-binding protein
VKKLTPATRYRKYVEQALEGGAQEVRITPVSNVKTAEWVRLKCQFGCGGFGKRLCCPPYAPTPEQMKRVLADYRHALIYSYILTPSDYSRKRRRMHLLVAELERRAFLDGYYKAFGLCAGPCRFCRVCDVTSRCKHPYQARPSMESCGIDVYATARNSGIRLEVATREDGLSKHINLLLIE